MAAITPPTFVRDLPTLEPLEPGARAAGGSGPSSFSDTLGKALAAVDATQVSADRQAEAVALGGGNLHEAALALEKADVAMKLAVKTRNKLVEAYQDIMRMSI
jgi:flagellar hook-basal body complex protein FliE